MARLSAKISALMSTVASMVLATSPAAVAQTVGKTAAVNPAATGSGRVLTLGAEVVHRERIQTSGNGSLQLLFLDRTTMNIGPNSDLVIDEYVFDPKTNSGKMSVSLGKGLMRFVGGQISHEGNATVNTPSAVIGIRGGMANIAVKPGGGTSASNVFGDMSFTSLLTGQMSNVPPGQKIENSPSLPGGAIGPITKSDTDSSVKNTTSKFGQTGGGSSNGASNAEKNSLLTNNLNVQPPPGPNGWGGTNTGTGTSDWTLHDLIQSQQTTAGNQGAAMSFPPAPPPPLPPPPPPPYD